MVLSLRERLDRYEPKGKRYKFGTELTKLGAKLAKSLRELLLFHGNDFALTDVQIALG